MTEGRIRRYFDPQRPKVLSKDIRRTRRRCQAALLLLQTQVCTGSCPHELLIDGNPTENRDIWMQALGQHCRVKYGPVSADEASLVTEARVRARGLFLDGHFIRIFQSRSRDQPDDHVSPNLILFNLHFLPKQRQPRELTQFIGITVCDITAKFDVVA